MFHFNNNNERSSYEFMDSMFHGVGVVIETRSSGVGHDDDAADPPDAKLKKTFILIELNFHV